MNRTDRVWSNAADQEPGDGLGDDDDGTTALPSVSLVMPMLDEIDWIERAVEALGAQDYSQELLQVLVVDGGSTDGSRELVAELAETRPWLHLVDNPDRRASAAFNRGIEAATGEIICIIGAHAEVGPDFVSASVAALEETGAAGVGGQLLHEGVDPTQQAIGLAMTSRFGMASPFRYSTERCEVDTIGHPAYRREVLEEVGSFDESLERNSDYELNHRIRRAGHTLVLDPSIVTLYRPRPTLGALARQFFDYGRGKANVARTYPDSMQARHYVAPAATLLAGAAPLLALSRPGRRLLGAATLGYAGMLVVAAAMAGLPDDDADLATFLASFPVMHLTWGAGFLVGVVRDR